MTPEEVVKLIEQENIQMIDLKFADLPGLWQHFSLPVSEVVGNDGKPTGMWEEGAGFDGSSIRGFQAIQESDMILMLDPNTASPDPMLKVPTLSVICDIYDPLTREPYSRDPRYIAKKAEKYLQTTGIADTSYWGPEAEFFIFDDVRFDQTANSGYYYIDSVEGVWNSGREENPNLGYKPRHKEGYFPTPPHDSLQDLRTDIVLEMAKVGIPIEVHHHEVGTAGQCEITMRYDELLTVTDRLMWYRYIVKNVSRQNNKVATFMPKPIFGDNGSGMHTHQSLWKDGTNLFFDKDGYALTSEMARHYAGGLLKHGRALMALCAPTTNSYKRLVPGFEAPVNLVYSARNRSAAVRIPMYADSPNSKRLEFRPPDNTCNPYLAFSAMLMAGLDGIENGTDPGEPLDQNTYELSAADEAALNTVPGSLEEALDALEEDHEFLLKGDVFTQDVLDVWIEFKRQQIEEINLRPHPYEFHLYFDM